MKFRFVYRRVLGAVVCLTTASLCLSTSFGQTAGNDSRPSLARRITKVFTGIETEFSDVEDASLSLLTAADKKMAIEQARQCAYLHPRPEEWDAAVFLPAAELSDVLTAGLRDGVIELPEFKAATFTVKKVAFRSGYGVGDVVLDLEAGIAQTGLRIDLVATGTLFYHGFSQSNDKGGTAALVIAIKALHPKRGGDISALLGQGAGAVLTLALKDHLRLDIPVPPVFAVDTGLEDTRPEDFHSLKTENEGEVKLAFKLKGGVVGTDVKYVSGLFVPAGLWLTLSQTSHVILPSPPPSAQLRDLLTNYESSAPKSVGVFLKGEAAAKILNDVAKTLKDDELRTLRAFAVDHKGDLLYKKWRDNTLGEGGTKVSLERNYSLNESPNDGPDADLKIGLDKEKPVQWTKDGLSVSLSYVASVRAPLHVHVDPLISGGMGTSVGCVGGGKGKMSGIIQLETISAKDGTRALAVRPVLGLGEIPIELKTNGKFKVGEVKLKALGGWTKIPGFEISVPRFAVKMTLPIGPQTLPAFSLLDNAPRRIKISDPKPIQKGPLLRLPTELRYLVIVPEKAVTDLVGTRVTCRLSVTAMTQDQARAKTQMIKDALKSQQRIRLPKSGNITVVLGDLEFGKNNDFGKILAAVFEGLDKVAAAAKEAGKKVEEEVSRAGRELEKAGQQIKDKPLVAVESFFNRRAKEIVRVTAKPKGKGNEALKDIEKKTGIRMPRL